MAVREVTETWVGGQASEMSKVRQFDVTFDTGDDPVARPIMAALAVDPVTGVAIPAYKQQHPYHLYSWVEDRETRAIGPFHYLVTVYYASDSTGDDPLDEPWDVSWGFARRTDVVDRDIDDEPIINRAGQSYNPPPTREYFDLTLTIVRNQLLFNPFQARAYIDSVNSDIFYGFAAGTVKCTDFSGDLMNKGASDYSYYRMRYAFAFRANTWKLELKNEGLAERINNATDGSFKGWKIITDFYSERMAEPVPLDINGRPQSPDLPIIIDKWQINKFMVFDYLGL